MKYIISASLTGTSVLIFGGIEVSWSLDLGLIPQCVPRVLMLATIVKSDVDLCVKFLNRI